jgi:hypothetical protein
LAAASKSVGRAGIASKRITRACLSDLEARVR